MFGHCVALKIFEKCSGNFLSLKIFQNFFLVTFYILVLRSVTKCEKLWDVILTVKLLFSVINAIGTKKQKYV